jgi:hypothetical protein
MFELELSTFLTGNGPHHKELTALKEKLRAEGAEKVTLKDALKHAGLMPALWFCTFCPLTGEELQILRGVAVGFVEPSMKFCETRLGGEKEDLRPQKALEAALTGGDRVASRAAHAAARQVFEVDNVACAVAVAASMACDPSQPRRVVHDVAQEMQLRAWREIRSHEAPADHEQAELKWQTEFFTQALEGQAFNAAPTP